MKRQVVISTIAALCLGSIIGLCGCGGGASSTPTTSTSATTRQIHVGDRVVYAVSGNGPGVVSGTVTIVINDAEASVASKYGGRVLKEAITSNLTVDGQPAINSNSSYIEQVTNGTVYDRDQDSTDNPSIMYSSPIHQRDTWSYSWQYGSGQQGISNYTVVGLEPMNGWMAYKIENATSDEDGQSINYEWYVPDLGVSVRLVQKMQYSAGAYLDATLNLQSKNF